MGTFLKNQHWYIDYYLPNHKRRREKIGKSRKLAEIVLGKRKAEIAEGKFLDIRKKERIKFEDFAQDFLNLHSKPNKKSWAGDYYNIKTLHKFFKDKYLFEITTQDIEQFKVSRMREVSAATVNRELATLKTMYSKAMIWGKAEGNPAKPVQFLREPKGRLRFLEAEEIIKLLSHCSKKLKPIVCLALFTGMRRGEILKLKWQDVDFHRNLIVLLDTKNGEKREIPMNEQVKTALMRAGRHPESEYIFCNSEGKPYQDIRKSFFTVLKKSGINNFHFHDLRHTFASQLVMSGIDINTVRELLGHKDIRMTLRYSHLSPSFKKRAVDILGKKVDTFWTLSQDSKTLDRRNNSQVFDKQLVR